MKKTILLLALFSFTFAGAASSSQNTMLAAAEQAKTPAPSIPEECTKLVAAIKACEKSGGFMESGCKQAAKSKFNCPIALDKLM